MISAKDLKNISSSLNILYAEDEEILRNGMNSSLSKLFKNCYLAENGQIALDLYKKEEIDIVLTDINMPIMDGKELIKNLTNINENIVIIVLSAHNESELLIELINSGVNYFINKPVDKQALINTLYKCSSIVHDKKLVKEYEQRIKEENQSMIRKNKILEQKLNQLARHTNKQDNKINKQIFKRKKNKKEEYDNYFKIILQDDRDDLRDFSEQLETYIMMLFQNNNINKKYVELLSKIYIKYANTIRLYTEFTDVAELLYDFSTIIVSLEDKFLENIPQTGIYLESLQVTLETFRQNIWEKEASDPKYYNASLKNDIQVIINFLQGKEVEDGEIEFF